MSRDMTISLTVAISVMIGCFVNNLFLKYIDGLLEGGGEPKCEICARIARLADERKGAVRLKEGDILAEHLRVTELGAGAGDGGETIQGSDVVQDFNGVWGEVANNADGVPDGGLTADKEVYSGEDEADKDAGDDASDNGSKQWCEHGGIEAKTDKEIEQKGARK